MIGIVLALIATAGAQPRFEVALVKANSNCANATAGGRSGGTASRINSPDRLDLRCRTLADLIKMAYVQFADGQRTFSPGEAQVSGGPPWMDSEHFDIDAKAEQPQSPEMMRGPMLQKLLEDRFQLKIHFTTTEIPVYTLSVAKGGPKLQPAQEGKCLPPGPGQPLPSASQRQAGVVPCGVFVPSRGKDDAARMYGGTLENFCRQLTALLGRKVIDKTGSEASSISKCSCSRCPMTRLAMPTPDRRRRRQKRALMPVRR